MQGVSLPIGRNDFPVSVDDMSTHDLTGPTSSKNFGRVISELSNFKFAFSSLSFHFLSVKTWCL